jgi:AcrR family transcriptional regulator
MSTQQTRSRLSADDWIAGGLQLLGDEGVAGVKIDVLAARLGVTKGSFYWHFESLPAFLEALTDHYCATRSAEAQTFDDTAPKDPRERLMYLMEEISDRSTRSLERAIRAWAESSNPRLATHVRQMDVWGFDEVLRCFEQLGFSGLHGQIRAKTLYYAGIGYVHTGSLGEPEHAEHREALLALLTRSDI